MSGAVRRANLHQVAARIRGMVAGHRSIQAHSQPVIILPGVDSIANIHGYGRRLFQ